MQDIKIPQRNKRPKLLKCVPNEAIKQWKENCWRELNRFAKLSSTPFITSIQGERIPWHAKITTDLQRAKKLNVSGDVNEVFEFPMFKTPEEKETLVITCVKFLNTAVEDLISELCSNLGSEGRKALAEKAVNQSLIALCQDFTNDPYFKILKNACEKYDLTPTSCTLRPEEDTPNANWRAGIKIQIETPLIYSHVCRTFRTLRVTGIEAEQTDMIYGFKRTYVVDILGGPPRILPPVFLSKNRRKAMEFFCEKFPKSNFKHEAGVIEEEKHREHLAKLANQIR